MTVRPQRPYSRFTSALLIACGPILCSPLAAIAEPAQDATEDLAAPSSGTTSQEEADNSGNDITRPVNSLEIRLRDEQSSKPGSITGKDYAILRVTTKVDLDPWWKVSFYAQSEGKDKRTTSTGPASTSTTNDAGLGDSVVQAVLIRKLDDQWAFGAGARIVAPTASDDLSSRKLSIMPGFGVRYSFLEDNPDTYFVPAMRYAVSITGAHSTRDISELQMAPTLNLDLPGPWFLTLYPSYDIRINYGPPVPGQTGRLFLPADAEIGYKLNDHIVIGLEGSVPLVKDYPVYDYKVQLRLIVKH